MSHAGSWPLDKAPVQISDYLNPFHMLSIGSLWSHDAAIDWPTEQREERWDKPFLNWSLSIVLYHWSLWSESRASYDKAHDRSCDESCDCHKGGTSWIYILADPSLGVFRIPYSVFHLLSGMPMTRWFDGSAMEGCRQLGGITDSFMNKRLMKVRTSCFC